jgi:hypothetical protein
MAQTFLTISPVPARIGSKDRLNFTLTLKDDFQEPMVGEKIVLNGSISGSTFRTQNATDAFGTVDFLNVTVPASHSGSLTYIASFEGEINYLPSSFSGTVDVVFPEQGDMTWLIPVIAVPIGGGSVSTYLWRKKREGADEESVTPVETEVSAVEVAPVTIELKNRLSIDFPQIRPSLPNVWGVGEPLTVRLRLEDSLAKPIPSAGVTLKVDSGSGRRLKTSNEGLTEVAHVFEGKGMHSLEGVYAHGAKKEIDRGFAEIRIVDYREEVVALFNSFFNAMSNKFPNIKKTTPREFQAFVAGKVSGSKVRSLDTTVLLFEIADYSLHSVKREEYEQMYLALKEFDEAAA